MFYGSLCEHGPALLYFGASASSVQLGHAEILARRLVRVKLTLEQNSRRRVKASRSFHKFRSKVSLIFKSVTYGFESENAMPCKWCTVVPALGDPRRERPPAVCGHFVNVPTHFKAKLPVISGHLPNADADSHLLVVSTCYNGQCKQMPRFRWSFQPKIAGAHPNLRPTDLSNFRAVVW